MGHTPRGRWVLIPRLNVPISINGGRGDVVGGWRVSCSGPGKKLVEGCHQGARSLDRSEDIVRRVSTDWSAEVGGGRTAGIRTEGIGTIVNRDRPRASLSRRDERDPRPNHPAMDRYTSTRDNGRLVQPLPLRAPVAGSVKAAPADVAPRWAGAVLLGAIGDDGGA